MDSLDQQLVDSRLSVKQGVDRVSIKISIKGDRHSTTDAVNKYTMIIHLDNYLQEFLMVSSLDQSMGLC